MSYQSINADKWDALVAWLQKTKNEEDTDIYAFLDECLGVSASGEDSSIYETEEDYIPISMKISAIRQVNEEIKTLNKN